MIRKYLALVSLYLIVAGCASQRPKPPSEEFSTAISADGQKLFVFTVAMPRPDRRGHRQLSGMPPGSRDTSGGGRPSGGHTTLPGDNWEEMKSGVYTLLHQKLDQTGYCPGGYGVDHATFGPVSTIEGYCIELDYRPSAGKPGS